MAGEEQRKRKFDYKEKKEAFIRFLGSKDNADMVLATSHENRVLARNVLIVNDGPDIYFFTWGHSRKCMQIRENPRVALCRDNVQIEGTAEVLGALSGEGGKVYTDFMRLQIKE